jgi:hypothetical protein
VDVGNQLPLVLLLLEPSQLGKARLSSVIYVFHVLLPLTLILWLSRYSNIFVTAPSPENLNTLFDFVCKGINALEYKVFVYYPVFG